MTAESQAALRAPFDDHLIGKLPKGGVMLDFVGHGAVRDRLLQVDPEWTWEPFALDAAGLPALDEFGNLWIRLTICGVTRPGVGDGPNMKERIGDALRNAGMSFGIALDLWIRGHGEDPEKQEQTRRPRPTAKPAEVKPLDGWTAVDEQEQAHKEFQTFVATTPDAVQAHMRDFRKDAGFSWPMPKADLDEMWSQLASAQTALAEPKVDEGEAPASGPESPPVEPTPEEKRAARARQVAEDNGLPIPEHLQGPAKARAALNGGRP